MPANKYRQEVDTNVFQLELNCLKGAADMAAGDPESCKSCSAILNKNSKLVPVEGQESTYTWVCEFCNTSNEVCLDAEEIPKSLAVNYLVEPAPQVETEEEKTTDTDKKVEKDISVVFCLDVSGSMGSHIRVNGG